jgi:acyl-CoA reductase-like NAD-dependent aldehyde dehydrogenase
VREILRPDSRKLLISGRLVAGDSAFECFNPNDGSSLGDVPEASAGQADQAAESSYQAYLAWRGSSVEERRRVVLEIAAAVRRRKDDLATLEAVSGGMPYARAQGDVANSAERAEYLASLAWEVKGTTVPGPAGEVRMTVREPYGPTLRIVAFNHSIGFSINKMVAPVLTGNSVIIKVPDLAPLAPLLLGEIIKDIVPPGLVTIVSGRGPVTGDALLRHPRIARVAFIGSVPTGRVILQRCAERIVPATLELGGKNPMIICADADPRSAAEAAVAGMNLSQAGQSCGSLSRVLVQEDLYDEVRELISAQLAGIVVGPALDSGTAMGPVISSAARDRIAARIDQAKQDGATVFTGGSTAVGLYSSGGYFVAPTLISDVSPEHAVSQEELFGPVQVILPWREPAEAIEIANNTAYGLVASIHTRDIGSALEMSGSIQAGSVAVNSPQVHWRGLPFGGYKLSGYGKDEDLTELLECTQVKSVALARPPAWRQDRM